LFDRVTIASPDPKANDSRALVRDPREHLRHDAIAARTIEPKGLWSGGAGAFEQNAVGTGDVRGATPLWVAAFSANGGGLFGENAAYIIDSDAAILRALLTAGADHRIATDDGTTPLMAAAGLGHRSYQPRRPRAPRSPGAEEAVRALVEAGADFLAVIGAIWSHPRGPRAAVAEWAEAGLAGYRDADPDPLAGVTEA